MHTLMPFSNGTDVLDENARKTALHEIGHILVTLGIGKGLSGSGTIAIEEGVCDYIAGVTRGVEIDQTNKSVTDYRIEISREQADRMSGLAQPDIDASIWGEERAGERYRVGVYIGLTHHSFGLELVNAFIVTFGANKLVPFLQELSKQVDNSLKYTFGMGTQWVEKAMINSGFSSTDIEKLRRELYKNLSTNVFKISGGGGMSERDIQARQAQGQPAPQPQSVPGAADKGTSGTKQTNDAEIAGTDDYSWQGGVSKQQAERIVNKVGYKGYKLSQVGISVDPPPLVQQVIMEVLGPNVNSSGVRRYVNPEILCVLDREMEGIKGPVRLHKSEYEEVIVIGESLWEKIQDGDIRAISALAHEFMAGCIVSYNTQAKEKINGEDAHDLAREVEKIILANAFIGQTPLLADVNEAKVDNSTCRALFKAIQSVSVMIRETKKWLEERDADEQRLRAMREESGAESSEADLLRRRKSEAWARLFHLRDAYTPEIRRIKIYLSDIMERLSDGDFEGKQIIINGRGLELKSIIQDYLISLKRSLEELDDLRDEEILYEATEGQRNKFNPFGATTVEKKLLRKGTQDVDHPQLDKKSYEKAMVQVAEMQAQDQEIKNKRMALGVFAPEQDYSHDGPASVPRTVGENNKDGSGTDLRPVPEPQPVFPLNASQYDISAEGFTLAINAGVAPNELKTICSIFAASFKLGQLALEKFKAGASIQTIHDDFGRALREIVWTESLSVKFPGENTVFVPARLRRVSNSALIAKAIKEGVIRTLSSLSALSREILAAYGIDVNDPNIYLVPVRASGSDNTMHNRDIAYKFGERRHPQAFVFKGVGLADKSEIARASGDLRTLFRKDAPPYEFRGGALENEDLAYTGAAGWLREKFLEYYRSHDPIFEELKRAGLAEDAVDMFIEPGAAFQPLLLPAYLSSQTASLSQEEKAVFASGLPMGLYAEGRLLDAGRLLAAVGFGREIADAQRICFYQTGAPERTEELATVTGRGGSAILRYKKGEYYRWQVFCDRLNLDAYNPAHRAILLKQMALRSLALLRILWNEGYSANTRFGSMVSISNDSPLYAFDYDTIGKGSKEARASDMATALFTIGIVGYALDLRDQVPVSMMPGVHWSLPNETEAERWAVDILKRMDPDAFRAFLNNERGDGGTFALSYGTIQNFAGHQPTSADVVIAAAISGPASVSSGKVGIAVGSRDEAAVVAERRYGAEELRQVLKSGSLNILWPTGEPMRAGQITNEKAELVITDEAGGYLLMNGAEGARYTFNKVGDHYEITGGGGMPERAIQESQQADFMQTVKAFSEINPLFGEVLLQIFRGPDGKTTVGEKRTFHQEDIAIIREALGDPALFGPFAQELIRAGFLEKDSDLAKKLCSPLTREETARIFYYTPQILANPLKFVTTRSDYSADPVFAAAFDYIDEVNKALIRSKYARDDYEASDIKHAEYSGSPESGIEDGFLPVAGEFRRVQREFWQRLKNLPPQDRKKIFGEKEPGLFDQKTFDGILTFALPRYLAGLGIFTVIADMPLTDGDGIFIHLYYQDLFEIKSISRSSAAPPGAAPVDKIAIGGHVSKAGKKITPFLEPRSAMSSYGNIEIISSTDVTAEDIMKEIGRADIQALSRLEDGEAFARLSALEANPLMINTTMAAVQVAKMMKNRTKEDLRKMGERIAEAHEAGHVSAGRRGAWRLFKGPKNAASFKEFIEAMVAFARYDETMAILNEIAQGNIALAFLSIANTMSGAIRPNDYHDSARVDINNKMVAIIYGSLAEYGFDTGSSKWQIQARLYRIVNNKTLMLKLVEKVAEGFVLIDGGLSNVTSQGYSAQELRRALREGEVDLRWPTKDDGVNWNKVTAIQINDHPDNKLFIDGKGGGYLVLNGARYALRKSQEEDYYLVEVGGMPEWISRLRQEWRARRTQGQTAGTAAPEEGITGYMKYSLLSNYIQDLQRSGDIEKYHHALKLISASINKNPRILRRRGPMTTKQYKDTLNRLDEFSTANTQRLIDSAKRNKDYDPIRAELAELLRMGFLMSNDGVISMPSSSASILSSQEATQQVTVRKKIDVDSLRKYLEELYKRTPISESPDDETVYDRTIKLILASINNEPLILAWRGHIGADQREGALRQLNEYRGGNLEVIIQQSGREDDYVSILEGLFILGFTQPEEIPPSAGGVNKEEGRSAAPAVATTIVPAEDIKARQTTTAGAFTSAEGKDNEVKVVVGIPVDMNIAKVQPTLSAVNRGLAKNGFGRIDDNKQVITFGIDVTDAVKTARNQKRAIQRAGKGLSPSSRIVLFAPQMENGPRLASKARERYRGQDNITVVPDAYSDSAPEKDKYPDIMARVALGRNIAFYYTGRDRENTLAAIKDLLSKIADNDLTGVGDLNDLLKKLNEIALRIRPVDYKTITDWRKSQEAVATAL